MPTPSGHWSPLPGRHRTPEDTEVVRSPQNRRVREAAALHRARRRRETGLTLVEGPRVLDEALAAGVVPVRVFVAEGRAAPAGGEVVVVTPAVLARISGTETPQGVVAVITVPGWEIPAAGGLLVAWGVSDPGNVGTLVRSAAAFGLGFVAGPGCADPWSPKVVRAGAGAHFRTAVGRVAGLEGLGGRLTVAAVARGGGPPASLRGVADPAVLVGDEAAGLPPGITAAADRRVTIPMPGGTESLNAAVAGSILAYEVACGGAGAPPD